MANEFKELIQRTIPTSRGYLHSLGDQDFHRFSGQVKDSNIPVDFPRAVWQVAEDIISVRPPRQAYLIRSDWGEISHRVLQKNFDKTGESAYALLYGCAVAEWKKYFLECRRHDGVINEVSMWGMGRFGDFVGGFTPEAVSELRASNQQTARQLNEAEVVRGITVLIERVAKRQDFAPFRVAQLIAQRFLSLPTTQDLDQVREYLEDYFSEPQNRSRLMLLAQKRGV